MTNKKCRTDVLNRLGLQRGTVSTRDCHDAFFVRKEMGLLDSPSHSITVVTQTVIYECQYLKKCFVQFCGEKSQL